MDFNQDYLCGHYFYELWTRVVRHGYDIRFDSKEGITVRSATEVIMRYSLIGNTEPSWRQIRDATDYFILAVREKQK